MTKEQVLASNEPRTVKLIEFVNSWGNQIGEGGHQWISEDYFNGTFVWACWTMIYNGNIKYTFVPTIRYGDKGLPVRMLQTKLGLSLVDGIFGKQTLLAVQRFQQSRSLVADGICGKLTCDALNL